MADIFELAQISAELFNKSKDSTLIFNKDKKFFLLRQESPANLGATVYEPALCLILQGRKEVITSQRSFSFGVGELLVISHGVPVVSKITEASASSPYLALVLGLDINIVRNLYNEYADIPFDKDQAHSLKVNEASSDIIDCLFRLLCASQSATDSVVLLPQILREVHYRLLQAPCGGMLRNLLQANSHASKISKAISLIHRRYSSSLSVADVARTVGMSTSSFFHHFKAITESTPLQYQKTLRLLEARKLLLSEGESVTLAALRVGYESPSQFSREYVRKFGSTPSSDSRAGLVG